MAKRLEAADKVTLLLSFVPFLLRNGSSSVSELAQRFEISEQQVKEIVQLLAVSGIPGESGMYQHQDLFDINWDLFEDDGIVELWNHIEVNSTPRFSAREAAALVAGLQYISSLVPETEKTEITELLRKISQAAASLPENILVAPAQSHPFTALISDVIDGQGTLQFNYLNSLGNQSSRLVDPLRLDIVGGTSYLRAWCHDNSALRTFRLDRMFDVAASQTPRISHISADDLSDDLFEAQESYLVGRFEVDDDVVLLLSAYKPVVISKSTPGKSLVEVSFASVEAMPRFIALFPGSITLVEPTEAKTAISDWVQAALANYS